MEGAEGQESSKKKGVRGCLSLPDLNATHTFKNPERTRRMPSTRTKYLPCMCSFCGPLRPICDALFLVYVSSLPQRKDLTNFDASPVPRKILSALCFTNVSWEATRPVECIESGERRGRSDGVSFLLVRFVNSFPVYGTRLQLNTIFVDFHL